MIALCEHLFFLLMCCCLQSVSVFDHNGVFPPTALGKSLIPLDSITAAGASHRLSNGVLLLLSCRVGECEVRKKICSTMHVVA